MPENPEKEVLDYELPRPKKKNWYSNWGEDLVRLWLVIQSIGQAIAVVLGVFNIGWDAKTGHPLIWMHHPWTLGWEFRKLALHTSVLFGALAVQFVLPKSSNTKIE